METRHGPLFFLCLLLLILAGTATASATTKPLPGRTHLADKAAVLDGHVVHDVGQIWNHVTNWGLIGSAPGPVTPFSDAPSAQWPRLSGNEYLWAAGLWVGGTVLGEARVTTGGFSTEFFPTEAPEDTIHATFHGAPGGRRFPWPGADDDGDGVEDEETLNGRDDDNDGLVDEDIAGWGDQHFVAACNDYDNSLVANLPEHTPLGLQIVQQSVQWGGPLGEDFIGYDFTITNAGSAAIEQVLVGMYSDFDIGPRGTPGISENDYAGYWSGPVQAADGSWVPVQVAYMYDGATTGRLDGYAGWVLCGHTTDPAGIAAPTAVGVHTFQRYSGNASFENGGDPTNDAERYQLLGSADSDPDVTPGHDADYRVLTSSGPFANLAPGQSLRYQVALVLGSGLDDMLANAAEAVRACRGRSYDRDGDPANGQEFNVPWLLDEEVPVAAYAGHLLAVAAPDGAELTISTNIAGASGLQVVRLAGPGVPERRWTAAEMETMGSTGAGYYYRIRDNDAVGWPRQYELSYNEAGYRLPLDEAGADLPRPANLALRAEPNPFNPQVNLHLSLPVAGETRLEIYDVRGHLVSTLLDGPQPAGEQDVVWRGQDRAGRSLASGVYQVRLTAAGRLTETRVTLVR
jgi:hypothetical protein